MTNLALEQAFGKLNIPFARAKVGDRYVNEMLLEKGWQYGGENSGHILALDKHTTGDGIVSALQVLTALRVNKTSLQDYSSELSLFPQVLVNVKTARGFDHKGNKDVEQAVEIAQKELGDDGRVLLRPSGTEPLLRVMVEGKSRDLVSQLANRIADHVRQAASK
jgi:phosphoglucosamine mutase